jgi:adenylate cyclase class IV
MNQNIEVELRGQILDENQIEPFVEKLEFIGEKHIVDVYLDNAETNDWYAKGVFIRIRNDKKIDFKFNIDDFLNEEVSENNKEHTHCEEYSYSLPLENLDINKVCDVLYLEKIDQPDLDSFLKKNNLSESYRLDKVRKTYKHEKFEIMIDDFGDFGKFVEIEALANSEDDLESLKKEMDKFISDLNVKKNGVGYCELYLRKYNFDLYKKGKYKLQQDM